MAAIQVEDLKVKYGDRTAVNGISFAAEPGQVTGLLGPNGAGKTTTVETLEGYRRPDGGSVRVLGLDPISDRKRLAPQIGVMLQSGGVYLRITPMQVFRLFAGYYSDPEDPEKLLSALVLNEAASTPWRHLSGGEKQRVSMGLALIGKPKVAFLDEPTAGVDPSGRLIIRQVIRDLAAQGVCILLTTHELEEAERLSDQLVIMDQGEIVATGSPSELMSQAGGEQIRFGTLAGLDTSMLATKVGAQIDEISPGEYVVDASPTPQLVAQVTAWLAEESLPLSDLRAGRGSLEDVFLRLTSSRSEGDSMPTSSSRRRNKRRGANR